MFKTNWSGGFSLSGHEALISLVGGWCTPSCKWPIRGMSLLKLHAILVLCVGWCSVRILIWSSIHGMKGY